MPDSMPLSGEGVALLQELARESEMPRGATNDGWIYHLPDYKPLLWLGLVEERDRPAGGIELRLTEFGWSMLADGLENVDV
jgi:hypothetical protein